jgi:hypothetical protein
MHTFAGIQLNSTNGSKRKKTDRYLKGRRCGSVAIAIPETLAR